MAILVNSDDDFRIVEANSAAEKLHGYGPGEMLGIPMARLYADPEFTADLLQKVLDGASELPPQRIRRHMNELPLSVTVATSISLM